jgi:hypothetical protein
MYARYVRHSLTGSWVALLGCLTCTFAFGDAGGGLGRFFESGGRTAGHEVAAESRQLLPAGTIDRTSENANNRVVAAGCDCRSTKPRPDAPSKKPEPTPEPTAAVAKTPVEITEPRLLPWWEEERRSGFVPVSVVNDDLTEQTDDVTEDTAAKAVAKDLSEKEPISGPAEARRRYFKDAIHVAVDDEGIKIFHTPPDEPR